MMFYLNHVDSTMEQHPFHNECDHCPVALIYSLAGQGCLLSKGEGCHLGQEDLQMRHSHKLLYNYNHNNSFHFYETFSSNSIQFKQLNNYLKMQMYLLTAQFREFSLDVVDAGCRGASWCSCCSSLFHEVFPQVGSISMASFAFGLTNTALRIV